MIPDLLPHLTNLSQINLYGNYISLSFLAAINHHPLTTVSLTPTTMYLSLPSQSAPSDLSKIVLNSVSVDGRPTSVGSLDSYLARGMEVTQVAVLDYLDQSLGTQKYNGLRELELQQYGGSFVPWLPEFTRTNPCLKKITFYNHYINTLLSLDSPGPFMSYFLAEVLSQGLAENFHLRKYAVTRSSSSLLASSATEPFGEWHVSGIFLRFLQWSSGRVLHVAQSLFPDISVLTIDTARVQIVRFCFLCLLVFY